jgi:L-ascorbate metabolism protein UlaG (beta-lactamase superfamily)
MEPAMDRSDPRPTPLPSARPDRATLARAMAARWKAAMRSGFRRYPRELSRAPARAEGQGRGAGWIPGADERDWAAWLGHASVLLDVGGTRVLIDPVLSDRIGVTLLGRTIGVERFTPPALRARDVPAVDVVLITHAHFDHLDRPTLAALANPRTHVVTARSTARLIPRGFGSVREVDWHGALDAGPLRIEALRPNHWGARTAWDRHRGFNSYLIRSGAGRTVLAAGDSAMTEAFARAAPHAPDLAIFGVGAYDPWIHAHATPEQVWEMFRQSGARTLLPVHHSTFELSDEPADEPIRRLLDAAGTERSRVAAVPVGGVVRM